MIIRYGMRPGKEDDEKKAVVQRKNHRIEIN